MLVVEDYKINLEIGNAKIDLLLKSTDTRDTIRAFAATFIGSYTANKINVILNSERIATKTLSV